MVMRETFCLVAVWVVAIYWALNLDFFDAARRRPSAIAREKAKLKQYVPKVQDFVEDRHTRYLQEN